MATEQSSAIGRRRLRGELRRAREAARLTQEQVAQEMEWSLSKLIRIETGAVGVSTNDLKALLRLYGVSDAQSIRELTNLARASRRKAAWWAPYRDLLSDPYRKFIELESAATVVRHFHPLVVPGPLQTQDYARAVVTSGGPLTLDDEAIERLVEVRMTRQRKLHARVERRITAVVGESAVRQVIGGPKVMREQLHSLLRDTPTGVTFRVVPFRAGAHPGLDGGFAILEFANPADKAVLYRDSAPLDLIDRDNPDLLSAYREGFRHLEEVALSREDTASLLTHLVDSLREA